VKRLVGLAVLAVTLGFGFRRGAPVEHPATPLAPGTLEVLSTRTHGARVLIWSRDAKLSRLDRASPPVHVLLVATPARLSLDGPTDGVWAVSLPGSPTIELRGGTTRGSTDARSRLVHFWNRGSLGVSTYF
jgi:hypothetical protein